MKKDKVKHRLALEDEHTTFKCNLCEVAVTSPIIFEENEVNLSQQVTHLMKAHEVELLAIIKDATGLEMDEIVSIPIRDLNIREKSKKCSPIIKKVISLIRRTRKSRKYAKDSRDKKEKEALELTEKNKKLRQEEEKFQESKKEMVSSIDKYIELYPEAQELKRNAKLEQHGELKKLKFHMHAIEELWDQTREVFSNENSSSDVVSDNADFA